MAYYLAQLCAALVLTVSPHRIVMGGGIMQRVPATVPLPPPPHPKHWPGLTRRIV